MVQRRDNTSTPLIEISTPLTTPYGDPPETAASLTVCSPHLSCRLANCFHTPGIHFISYHISYPYIDPIGNPMAIMSQTHACTQTHTHRHTHRHTQTHTHTQTRADTHTHTHMRTHTQRHTHILHTTCNCTRNPLLSTTVERGSSVVKVQAHRQEVKVQVAEVLIKWCGV